MTNLLASSLRARTDLVRCGRETGRKLKPSRNRREKLWIQSEQSDFWYEPHRCPENGLDKYFFMLSGGPGDASDSPGGHLRGILTPRCSGRGKGPRLFRLRGQISLEISGIVFSFEGSDFQENF